MGRLFTKEKLKNCCLSLLLAALVAAAGGCGGGSDGTAREKLYVAGELHGDLADELAALLPCRPYEGQSGGPLIVSYDDEQGMDEQTAEEARRVLDAGYAVGIMHATEAEINKFLGDLGVDGEFMMPEFRENGAEIEHGYVEFFGIKIIDGDVLTYVTLNDDQQAEELNTTPDEIYTTVDIEDVKDHGDHDYPEDAIISADVISGDACVAVSLDHYLEEHSAPEATAEDIAEMEARKDELPDGWELRDDGDGTYTVLNADGIEATSADLYEAGIDVITPQDEPVPGMESESGETRAATERTMAENIIEWLFSTDMQAASAASAKLAVANSLNAANSTGGDLKQVMNMYQKTYDASAYNQVFKIFVDVYACHTYNAAASQDNKQADTDWFFVKQYAQLNPSGNYANTKHNGTTTAHIKGYMVYYAFDNWVVDANGSEYTNGVELLKPKPESTVGSTTSGESTSFSFGGNVGFSGLSASGGLSFGGSYSYEQSTTVPDCQVDNQSLADGAETHAKWKYSFSRPQTTGHPCIGCNDFKDAPTSARSLFQPENQWTWQLSQAARNSVKGFKFSFKWQNGYSNSEAFAWWIKVANVEHVDWVNCETTFYVPFDSIFPPLIAANNVDVDASARVVRVDVGTCHKWTATVTEGADWCSVDDINVDSSHLQNYMHVGIDRNDTGKSRTAKIKLSTTDNTNASCEITVYQSRY